MERAEVWERYSDLFELHRSSPAFIGAFEVAEERLLAGDIDSAWEVLDEIPSLDKLFEELYVHLKGKSVHKTLMRLKAGKIKNRYEGLKGLSSLLTHIMVECEKGNLRFHGAALRVAEVIQDKLGKVKGTDGYS